MSTLSGTTREPRVRFAPSPTGYLHVGGARTALFNWLFARGQRGAMILRVEDTDAERNRPELVEGILEGLRWLGIDWDEGPYYQSQRLALYQEAAQKCLANGSAFLCFCPADRYAGGDAAEEGASGGTVRGGVPCSCRDGKASSQDTKPAIRFKVPLSGGTEFQDAGFGRGEIANEEIEGFLPEALRNFLALLGWSAGGDQEFLRTRELVEKFSLEGVSRTNAVFDRAKLEWFNTQYLQKLPVEELLPEVERELKRSKLWRDEWANGAGREWFAKTVDLLRPRIRLLPDFSTWARAFFSDEFSYDPAAKEKFWKDERLPALLAKLADALEALPEWNHDACDHALRALAEAEAVKAGLLINATRVAIVGQAVAPPLFETMVVLGRERVIGRLRRALPLPTPKRPLPPPHYFPPHTPRCNHF